MLTDRPSEPPSRIQHLDTMGPNTTSSPRKSRISPPKTQVSLAEPKCPTHQQSKQQPPGTSPATAMDLLSAAYSATSDDEEDDDRPPSSLPAATSFAPPPLKRPRWEYQPHLPPPRSSLQPPLPNAPPPASGRYISKRERALLATSTASLLPQQTTAELGSSGEPFGPFRSCLLGSEICLLSMLIYPSTSI